MISIDKRSRILIAFILLFGWVKAFPYEGPVLYAMADSNDMNSHLLNALSVLLLSLGLFTGRFLSSNLKDLKRTLFICLMGTLLISVLIPILPETPWLILIPTLSVLMGLIISGYAHIITVYTSQGERETIGAEILIGSYIILVLSQIVAVYISPISSFILLELLLLASLVLINGLDVDKPSSTIRLSSSEYSSLGKFWVFFLFIFMLSLNSGILFQVILPYYSAFEEITSLYSFVPFIITVYLLSNIIRVNKLNFLYLALCFWGAAFLAFSRLPSTEWSYFIVGSLIFISMGILEYFWWTTLTTNFHTVKNPASLFGLALSLNILGVWIGGQAGWQLMSIGLKKDDLADIGLLIVMVSMMIVLPLNKRMTVFIKTNPFLLEMNKWNPLNESNKNLYIEKAMSLLSTREYEVFSLLISGHTDPEISEMLSISLNTTKTHNRRIYRKLDVKGRTELIKNAENQLD